MKLLFGELIFASLGNINSNFHSISFEPVGENGIKICFILHKIGPLEEELVQEIVEEFEAQHGSIDELIWNSYLSTSSYQPLENIVFMATDGKENIIFQESYSYSFFQKAGKYLLNVMIGGAAMFDFTIQLKESEISQYKEDGKSYIENLVKQIQNNHKPYLKRKI